MALIESGLAGTAELLLVPEIRRRIQSWRHGVSAMMLIALLGLNWGVKMQEQTVPLMHVMFLSVISAIFVGLAGWHGGKLIFHHGVGVMVSSDEEDA